MHRNVKLDDSEQTPAKFIANSEPTENCEGVWVLASVAPDGNTYTVQIGAEGTPDNYKDAALPVVVSTRQRSAPPVGVSRVRSARGDFSARASCIPDTRRSLAGKLSQELVDEETEAGPSWTGL